MTAIYSILHMLVDGICALAVFGYFISWENGHFYLMLYNFCAFALQMPLGTLLDLLNLRQKVQKADYAYLFALLGVAVTLVGAVTHPVVLGSGNALFHVGGGVGAIHEDAAKHWRGRGLGVFVAPGAFGLYLGTLVAKQGYASAGLIGIGIVAVLGCIVAEHLHRKSKRAQIDIVCGAGKFETGESQKEIRLGLLGLAVSCFLVVILRSYIGMTVTFPWKQVPVLGLCSVFAVVGGKAAGGFLAARFGYRRTAVISLFLAAISYVGLSVAPIGLAALFLFNMTMPITLYLLICAYPKLPGFSFGLLTFGLFLGFLPSYLAAELPISGQIIGSVGSLISLALLMLGMILGGRSERVPD